MDKPNRPVLVTGADTGIGRYAVETLTKKGYEIYAGAYLETNIAELNKLDNVKAVQLDVTNQASVSKVKTWIEEQNKGLYGIVNNAGVSDMWPVMEMHEDEFHRVLNVNLYGVYRVSKELMPLIIEAKGRITTLGSLSGTIPTKFIGPYSVSKFGVEALMDIIYFEVKHLGVHVSTIKPGNVKSDISRQMVPIFQKRKDRISSSNYKQLLEGLEANLSNSEYLERGEYESPERVVNAIEHAMFSDNPKSKYLVTDEKDTLSAIGWMFRVVGQLNQNHDFTLDSKTLHEMLDIQIQKFT